MFHSIDAPRRKKDWPGHWLSLDAPYPAGRVTAPVVLIMRRKNAMDTQNSSHDVAHWGGVRILKVCWQCPECGAHHSGYLPERLIDEGKAVFMKKTAQPQGDHHDQG